MQLITTRSQQKVGGRVKEVQSRYSSHPRDLMENNRNSRIEEICPY
jgi:hypothetical protein